ncbi:MAG: type II toxin-antitoxin system VapC family toxin [Nitrospirae bacterium]|nr:type II toxin-antitoxin system VapC family toxin [Nitrospirota bacterium]
MLIDTDVLIWHLKGNIKAKNVIEKHRGFSISVVNYIELVQGLRNKKELNALKKTFLHWQPRLLYITEEISIKAMFLIEEYFLSHSLQLADALIAATALSHNLTLLSGNYKHFKAIKGLKVAKFIP